MTDSGFQRNTTVRRRAFFPRFTQALNRQAMREILYRLHIVPYRPERLDCSTNKGRAMQNNWYFSEAGLMKSTNYQPSPGNKWLSHRIPKFDQCGRVMTVRRRTNNSLSIQPCNGLDFFMETDRRQYVMCKICLKIILVLHVLYQSTKTVGALSN